MIASHQRKSQLLWMLPTPAYLADGIVVDFDGAALYLRNPSLKLMTLIRSESQALIVAILAAVVFGMAGWFYTTSKVGDPKFHFYLSIAAIILFGGAVHVLHSSVRIEWDEHHKELVVNRRWFWTWKDERFDVNEASILMFSMTFRKWPIVAERRKCRYLVAVVLKRTCFLSGGYGSIEEAIEACSRLEHCTGSLSYRWNDVDVVLWTAMYGWFLGLFDSRISVLSTGASPPTRSPSEFLRFDCLDTI
jgi:hypothetical protein